MARCDTALRPLRHHALQPYAADVIEHARAATRQMLSKPYGSPLGPAEYLDEPPPLALDQRQVAQFVAVMLDQIEREQHCLMAPALAPQRMEVQRAVVAGDHGLAVVQERS